MLSRGNTEPGGHFTCNICGRSNPYAGMTPDREKPSCSHCGSNLRTRGIVQVLSMELFGVNLTLPEFPRVKSLKGIGISDSSDYAVPLAAKLDYRNTFYHREPRLDITNPPEDELGRYDFLISSDIFEHVPPPVDAAFRNARRLLKPSGLLLLTVPYSLEASTAEHFPELHDYGFATLADRTVLVNRTRDGRMQVYEDIVFHGGGGATLEMREFTEEGVKQALAAAGFSSVRIYSEDYRPFGIVRSEAWSLPIAARQGPFALSADATRDVLTEWRDLNHKFHGEMRRLDRAFWFRVGRRLGFLR